MDSKFSFYDIVAMIIPGSILVLSFSQLFFDDLSFIGNEIFLNGLIVISISYPVGLVNATFSAILWSPFRNNIHCLKNSLNSCNIENSKYLKDIKNDIDVKPENTGYTSFSLFYMTTCVLLVCIVLVKFQIIVSFDLFRTYINVGHGYGVINNLVNVSLLSFLFVIVILYICIRKIIGEKSQKEKISDIYYEKYYYVENRRQNENILILEGQVAFMQNLIIPILVFVCLCKYSFVNIYFITSIMILLPFLWLTIFIRQNKIYTKVWEDYEYFKRLESNYNNRVIESS